MAMLDYAGMAIFVVVIPACCCEVDDDVRRSCSPRFRVTLPNYFADCAS